MVGELTVVHKATQHCSVTHQIHSPEEKPQIRWLRRQGKLRLGDTVCTVIYEVTCLVVKYMDDTSRHAFNPVAEVFEILEGLQVAA